MNRVVGVAKDKHMTFQVGKSSPEDLGKVLYLPKDADVKEGQVISTK